MCQGQGGVQRSPAEEHPRLSLAPFLCPLGEVPIPLAFTLVGSGLQPSCLLLPGEPSLAGNPGPGRWPRHRFRDSQVPTDRWALSNIFTGLLLHCHSCSKIWQSSGAEVSLLETPFPQHSFLIPLSLHQDTSPGSLVAQNGISIQTNMYTRTGSVASSCSARVYRRSKDLCCEESQRDDSRALEFIFTGIIIEAVHPLHPGASKLSLPCYS